MPRRRPAARDVVLVALALVFGSPALTFPFGRDQGLFHYIGREWFVHGTLPYRDAVEHKTPGIFVVHGLLYSVFGEGMWPIRVLDLALVLLIGCAAAGVVRDRPWRTHGLVGATCLSLAIFYYGFFCFWDQAQCEIVCAGLAAASLWWARRGRHVWLAELGAGVLGGAAFVVKPPVLALIGVTGLVVLARAWVRDRGTPRWTSRSALRRAVAGALRFGAGLAAAPLLVIGYFKAHGALADLRFWIVDVNRYYVTNERNEDSLVAGTRGAFLDYSTFAPAVLTIAVIGGIAAWQRSRPPGTERAEALRARHDLAGHVLAGCLFLAAYAGMVVQYKFFHYHGVLFVLPFALLVSVVFFELERLVGAARREWVALVPPAVTALLFVLATWSTDPWMRVHRRVLGYLGGKLSREEFTEAFSMPSMGYSFHDSELAGLWLRAHSDPDDNITVRGFQAEIYTVARRRYRHRFFWTHFIADPRRSMRREAWLAEETALLATDPPRFAVTICDEGGVDCSDWFEPHGYAPRVRFGHLRILERPQAAAAGDRPEPP